MLDRATIGSGGSGKSSGIVRCHYGVRSLAAMAWHALPVLADAPEILGAESGYREHRVPGRAWGRRTSAPCGPTWPCTRASASRWSWSARTRHRTCGRSAEPERLRRVRLRAARRLRGWPPDGAGLRGGRPAGVGPAFARTVPVARSTAVVTRASGVRLGERRTHRQLVRWYWPPGRGRCRWRLRWGSTCRSGRSGPRSCWSTRACLGRGARLLRPGLAAIRADRGGHLAPGGRQRPLRSRSGPIRTTTGNAPPTTSWPRRSRSSTAGSPACRRPLSSSYAGCYDVTPDYNPMISASPVAGLWLCAGFSGHGYKISPAVGELMADLVTGGQQPGPEVDHHDFRLERFAEGIFWSAPTLMPGQVRCAECRHPGIAGRGGIY